jgi:hypothetical protein
MSALVSITITFPTGLRVAGKTTRLEYLFYQPALAFALTAEAGLLLAMWRYCWTSHLALCWVFSWSAWVC